MLNRRPNLNDIKHLFHGRQVVNITNRGKYTTDYVYAIAINKEEEQEVIENFQNKKPFKNVDVKYLMAVGETTEPTHAILDLLPYIETEALWENTKIKSYFNPASNKFNTRKDMVICFENSRSLWNYYSKILLKDKRYDRVLILKGEK